MMIRSIFSILGAFFLALSMAMNWQAFAELKEMKTVFHRVAYSDNDHCDADHVPDADHDHRTHCGDDVVGHPTYKHSHGPGEPEHEHTHADLGFINALVTTNGSSSSAASLLFIPHVRENEAIVNECVPSSWVLSSLLRPPIA